MTTINDLEIEINKIKERNERVETEKLWETSWTRRILVAALTYIIIGIFFYYAGFPNPFKNAIVPTIAFILSTSSIPFFKSFWLKYIYKK